MGVFPSKNIYHNNLAQSIELLHSIDSALEILESSEFKEETVPTIAVKAGKGVGVVEAPRGMLYYMVSVDKTGKVEYGSIIVPTQQNQICMEKTVVQTVEAEHRQGQELHRARDREDDKGLRPVHELRQPLPQDKLEVMRSVSCASASSSSMSIGTQKTLTLSR